MKSKKGYLIDPKNQSMTEVEVGEYKDIQKHLKEVPCAFEYGQQVKEAGENNDNG